MTYEGAAHFFLGPKAENFVISCWDRLNGIQKKNCPKNNTKNDPSIAHSYSYRGMSNVTQQIFTTLKIIAQPNMYTTTTIPKLYALNLFCKSISRNVVMGKLRTAVKRISCRLPPGKYAARLRFICGYIIESCTLSSIHLIILTAVIIANSKYI